MNPEKAIKRLELELTALQDEQTALLRKKYHLEDELRAKKKLIAELEMRETDATEGKKAWQKITAILLAAWLLFLSLTGIKRD